MCETWVETSRILSYQACASSFYNTGRKHWCRLPVRGKICSPQKPSNAHHYFAVFFHFCHFSKLSLLIPFLIFLIPDSTISRNRLSVSQGNWLSAPLKCLTFFSPISAGLFWPLEVWAVMGRKGWHDRGFYWRSAEENQASFHTYYVMLICVRNRGSFTPPPLLSLPASLILGPIFWWPQIPSLLACLCFFPCLTSLHDGNFLELWRRTSMLMHRSLPRPPKMQISACRSCCSIYKWTSVLRTAIAKWVLLISDLYLNANDVLLNKESQMKFRGAWVPGTPNSNSRRRTSGQIVVNNNNRTTKLIPF